MAIELQQDSFTVDGQQEKLILLQAVVEIIQTQCYRMEGSVTKVMSYEGGLIVTATWGMQFLSHTDDCSRAVYAALNIKK